MFFGAPAFHVGIYAGNGMMWDSPRTGKVDRAALDLVLQRHLRSPLTVATSGPPARDVPEPSSPGEGARVVPVGVRLQA